MDSPVSSARSINRLARCVWKFTGGLRPSQNQLAKTVNKIRRHLVVTDKKSHVNRAVERIEKQIHIDVLTKFAATNSATKRGVSFQTPGHEETLTESGDEISVALAAAKNGGNDSAAPAAKDFDQLAHLLAHIRKEGAGIGEVKRTCRAVRERVCDQGSLIGPPAVNGRFADTGMSRHLFNGEIGKTMFSQNFQSTAQNGKARLLTARTPRTTSVAPAVVVISRRYLAHGVTLSYKYTVV